MSRLHKADNPEEPQVAMEEDGFLDLAGEIGASTVASFDCGSVPAAFKAWCSVFQIEFDTVSGSDGGDWLLAKELTFELFCKVVSRMPSDKAVRQDGFSIELL